MAQKTKEGKKKISDELQELQKIVDWFESQEEINLEDGLQKVKDGSKIIKHLKSQIEAAENEFEVIKKDFKI